MRTHKAALSRPAEVPGRALAVLAALAVALGAGFVLAPGRLAANGSENGFSHQQGLVDALRPAFIAYWRSGDRRFPRTWTGSSATGSASTWSRAYWPGPC